MKNWITYIFSIVFAVVFLLSCSRDEFMEEQVQPGEETWVSLDFGDKNFDDINISTRATLDITQESRVLNMYVFLFAPDGNRIYSHYFNKDNRLDNRTQVTSADMNCW